MLKLRTTKTASGKTAVQVVARSHQQTKIIKHIGSAGNEDELRFLRKQAERYIANSQNTTPLFPELFGVPRPLLLSELEQVVDRLSFTSTYHTFAHEFLSHFYEHNGFTALQNNLLRDLSFMRIIEPASKIRSGALFNKYFGNTYTQNMLYKGLPKMRLLKEAAEKIAVSYAEKQLGFDFSLVFYDVTTLYFETHTSDEDRQDTQGNTIKGFRTPGFSKDNKPQQPQIVIGLVVNRDGYPILVELFSGKTFEGHTILPVIKTLKARHSIKTLTIVADAAMLSLDNTKDINEANLNYIVGARLGNLSLEMLKEIAKKLNKTEGIYSKTETPRGTLICDYSEKRATKDRSDREKQLAKAQRQIDNPDTVKRRTRFVTEETKATLKLNEELLEQDILREGIKGYYTNLTLNDELTEKDIVIRYKDLWRIEKAFRIAKSDLEARPIFHRKKESIETHLLIVFVGLCLAKSIELETGYSIQKVKDMIWDVLDIVFVDTLTNKQFLKRMQTTGNPMAELLEKRKCG